MPGTIHVSVPEFRDLPSSIPPSSISTKVTMGKREYQTRDNGDFSFPLTNLRDSLTITIQDTEGNEMSQTVVQIMSVVERGSWDEFISLEGGGNVHMSLQFVLSEEERDRVRSMRESALKKKRDELLCKSLRHTETASTSGDSITSSLGINNEVSDLKRSIAQSQALSIADPPFRVGDGGTSFDERQIKPNDTDGSEKTSLADSMSKSLEVDLGDLSRKSEQNIDTKLQEVDLLKRLVLLEESTSATKESLVSSKVKMFQADQPEKQDPLGKTPSDVRKMRSAFERSLAEDIRPCIKPRPAVVKLQPEDPILEDLARLRKTSEVLKKPSLFGESQQIQTYEVKRAEHIGFGKDFNGDQNLEVKRKPVKPTSEMLKNPFVIGESQQIQPYKVKKEVHIASDIDLNWSKRSQEDGHLKEPSTTSIRFKENESIWKSRGGAWRLGEVQQVRTYKAKREEHIGFDEDLNRSNSSLGTGQLKEPSIALIQVEETRSSVENESGKKQNNEVMSAVEAATKVESAALFGNEDFPCESSGAWIFPDHVRRLCITTGSIEVVTGLVEGFGTQEKTSKGRNSFPLPEGVTGLVEGFGTQEKTSKGRNSFPLPEHEKPNIQPEDCDVVNSGNEISDELRTTELDNSAEVEASNGPLGQGVKVAIMVAFGVLVLLTRQREHR